MQPRRLPHAVAFFRKVSLACLVAFAALVIATPRVSAQNLTPEEAASMLLDSARRAYNERNHAFAIQRFREFLAKYGGHKEATSARYGLGLALLEAPERDYNAAAEVLQQAAGVQDFADRPFVLYHYGLALRGQGHHSLAQTAAKPNEAPQHRNAANQRFEQAANQFAAALAGFVARVKTPPAAGAKELPLDLEWAARARCDLAEMQLRLGKFKEAQATALPFTNDASMLKSKYRNAGLYDHGYACFALKEYIAAGRSLAALSPFTDPVYGVHARYLLARVHHLADERPEAALHYEAVLAGFDQHKKAAAEALKDPNKYKDNSEERARLDGLVKNPPPDYVARAAFFAGVLQFENGKPAEALPRFATFAQQYSGSVLIPEAQLRLGFCQVQLKQFAEAIKTLQPLEGQQPKLADQALLWLARAQIGAADVNNAQTYEQSLRAAMDTLRRAADRAGQNAAADPEAKVRRGDVLLELADTQQLAKQFKEAANTYQQVLNEKNNTDRLEEALQHQAVALHLAAQFKESDDVCQRFLQTYPKSTLLPSVLFRFAENAYQTAVAAANQPNLPNRDPELKRLYTEAAKRYLAIVDKYPEFPQINLARDGLALAHYRLGDLEKAKSAFETIPASDRSGELAAVPYFLADCLIRLAPTEANDALAAGRIQEQLGEAIKLLDGFLGANPQSPLLPEALLKLGHCHQQIAAILADPQERAKSVLAARQVYERIIQQFANHPSQPVAVFERAKCLALAGDANGAINELVKFTNDPLKNHAVAPLAVLRLATLLRVQKKPADAVAHLDKCRQQHEGNLLKDPAKVEIALMLRYHQGLAFKDAGKLPEAKALFEGIGREFPNRPEAAEAIWRAGQCRKEETLTKIEAAQKALAKPGAKPEEIAQASAALQEALKSLRDTAQFFQDQAGVVAQKASGSEGHLRLLYEAVWCQRHLSDHEIAAFRKKSQEDALKRLQQEATQKIAAGQPLPSFVVAEVPLKAVPLQPSEQNARNLYKAMIAAGPDAALGVDARFELAEMLALREEYDGAIQLLSQALEKDSRGELLDRVRMRLAACHQARGDFKAAFGHFDAIAKDPKSSLAGEARYRAGECLVQQGGQGALKQHWEAAVPYLLPFRDQPPLQNLPGISDRALLRLGHVHAHLNQWDASRQTLEVLAARFPQSPWLHEARYGIGWAWQNQKQFDNAVNVYTQVTNVTASEVAARAQLQLGLCRLEQKRHPEAANALLVVPYTYDFPELSALALCEASRAFVEMKQPAQATRLLQKIVKDHPQSQWAEVARQRLAEIK